MTAQKGKDLLLKLDGTGEGSFVTVAGLRSRAIAFNARAVDVTHATDCPTIDKKQIRPNPLISVRVFI